MPLIHRDGVILGYRLLLKREDDGPVVWNITVRPDVHGYIFSGLLIFQNYSIQILAFTIKGDGPLSEKVYQMTDESGELNGLELKRTLRLVIKRGLTLTKHVNVIVNGTRRVKNRVEKN